MSTMCSKFWFSPDGHQIFLCFFLLCCFGFAFCPQILLQFMFLPVFFTNGSIPDLGSQARKRNLPPNYQSTFKIVPTNPPPPLILQPSSSTPPRTEPTNASRPSKLCHIDPIQKSPPFFFLKQATTDTKHDAVCRNVLRSSRNVSTSNRNVLRSGCNVPMWGDDKNVKSQRT